MKILFWLLAIVSIPVGLFMSFTSYFSYGLGMYYTAFGAGVCMLGMLSVVVSIVCVVLGIIKLRKGHVKKAVALALAAVAYSGIILGGMFIEEAMDTASMEQAIADRKDEMYGENWDSAPAISDLPEQYVALLNEFYAIVDNQMDDTLMDFGLVSMPNYI